MTDRMIGGGKNRRLQVQAPRGARKAAPRRNGFTPSKRKAFLNFFAATCNAKGAARAAGVSASTIFEWRRKNAQFCAGWEAALEQGYVRLEAELVREANAALRPDGEAGPPVALFGMDAKTALATLEAYRRNRGARPGDILPRASDLAQVRARLEAKMRRLRIIDPDGRLIARSGGGDSGEDRDGNSKAKGKKKGGGTP